MWLVVLVHFPELEPITISLHAELQIPEYILMCEQEILENQVM